MPRKTRGPQRFAAITYDQLATWTGLSIETIRSYGSRGQIPRDDVLECLEWVNARRVTKGWPPVGVPNDHDPPDNQPTISEIVPNSDSPTTGGYNPITGEYQ